MSIVYNIIFHLFNPVVMLSCFKAIIPIIIPVKMRHTPPISISHALHQSYIAAQFAVPVPPAATAPPANEKGALMQSQ